MMKQLDQFISCMVEYAPTLSADSMPVPNVVIEAGAGVE
jgi:hypothetical protein